MVFAHHIEVLDGIEAEVKKAKVRYIRIDGSTSMHQRYALSRAPGSRLHSPRRLQA